MDIWTVIIFGLLVIPALGMFAVLADLVDAYNEFVIVRVAEAGDLEDAHVRNALLAQCARAALLITLAIIAATALADILTKTGLAVGLYAFALVLVGDGFRARRARKRMVHLIEIERRTEDERERERDAEREAGRRPE